MSWSRQIKILFTISYLIFTYIIWVTVSTMLIKNDANYMVYIISLSSVFLMQYLREKEKKYLWQLAIPIVMAVVINVVIFNIFSALCNFLYVLLILIFFNGFENEEINYEMYKSRIKKAIYVLIALGAVLLIVNKALAHNVVRFYLIYLISAIIVLREARKFCSRINDNNSLYVNLAIIFSVTLLSMDKVYNFLALIFSYIWLGISFVLVKIAIVMAYIVTYLIIIPLGFIMNLIFSYLGKEPYVYKEGNRGVNLSKLPDLVEQKNSSNDFVFMLILKIVVVAIIVYLVFRIFGSYVRNSSDNDDGKVEKEKILRQNKNRKNKEGNLSKFMKIFKGKVDVRTEILNVYLKFQQKMSEEKIYKPHMTAGQLSSVAKTQIDDAENINSITEIYNEAKFSNHKVTEENARTAKSNYERLLEKL